MQITENNACYVKDSEMLCSIKVNFQRQPIRVKRKL